MSHRSRLAGTLVAAAAAMACALAAAPAALAFPSQLDPTFGHGGVVLTTGGENAGATGVVRLAEGSLVVLGTATGGGGQPVTKLARYDSAGSPDAGFGEAGIVSLPQFGGRAFSGVALAQASAGGDLILAGTLHGPSGTSGDFALVAVDASTGRLDSAFGGEGIVDTPIGEAGSAVAAAVAVDPASGEILVGGSAAVGGVRELALAAYEADGARLAGFGASGETLTPVSGGDAEVSALALDGADVVAAGTAEAGGVAVVARYLPDGQLDPSFGGGSPVLAPAPGGGPSTAAAAVVDPDHSIVIGGSDTLLSGGCLALAKLNSDGSLDTSFGSSAGHAELCNGLYASANALVSGPDGLYAAGEQVDAEGSTHLLLARFTAAGAPDEGFAAGGEVTSDPNGAGHESQANAAALDGVHIVVAGEAAGATVAQRQFVLERYLGGNAPVNTAAPAISPSTPASVGQRLTASPGEWSGTQPIAFTYAWLRCPGSAPTGCATVQSGSANSYTLAAADAGVHILVEVAAANLAGTTTAYSTATPAVLAPAPSPSPGSGAHGPSGSPGSSGAAGASPGAGIQLPQLVGCGERVIIGPLTAAGCFKQVGRTWVASGELSINGIYLLPDSAGATVTFDPEKLTVTAQGSWSFQIGPVIIGPKKFGPWLVYKGKFKWDFSAAGLPKLHLPKVLPTHISLPGSLDASLPAIAIPTLPSFSFLGLPVVGTPTLKPAGGGATITVPVGLPKALGGITGAITLHADEATGLHVSGLHVAVPDLMLGPVELKSSDLSYQPEADDWQAATTLVLPTPNRTEVGASIEISGGQLKAISAHTEKAQLPIGPGAFLQGISASLQLSPLHIGGTVQITAGPTVLGKSAATIDGDLTYDLGAHSSKLEVGGTLTLAGLKLAQASLDYLVNDGAWSIEVNGQFGYSHTFHGPFGLSSTVGATGVLKGDIYGGGDFYADAAAQISAPLIGTARGEVRANRHSMAACAAIGNGWGQLAGGFVYPWGGSPQMFTGCDLGRYVTDSRGAGAATADVSARLARAGAGPAAGVPRHRGAAAAAAVAGDGARSLLLPSGLPMAALQISGSGAPPLVTLSGPHHTSVSVPATGLGIRTSRYLVYRDFETDTTYLLINHPAAGRWTVRPQPGSPAITGLRSAEGLPSPRVHAKVISHGRKRRLRYSLAPLSGQQVRFLERGKGVSRLLGAAHGARGTIAIPAAGPSGRRTIVAEVLQDGMPRATLTIARYRAPSPASLGAPRKLVARRHGNRVIVDFARVRGAVGYLVHAKLSTGASTDSVLPARQHRTAIAAVLPQASVHVLVRPIEASGAQGHASSVVLAADRKRARSHAHRHG